MIVASLRKKQITTHFRYGFAAVICVAFLGFAGTGSVAAQNEQFIVALVNDSPITNYDVTQRLRLLTVTTSRKPSDALRKKVIQDLISERIQLQEATKNSVVIPDEEVNKVFALVAKSNKMTAEQLTASLAQMGVHVKTMKHQIRARLAWRKVVQKKFRGQIAVNASQIDKAISSEEPASGKKEIEFQLQRIQLKLPDSSDQKKIAVRLVEAERLRTRFRSCSNIAEITKLVRKVTVKSVGRKQASKLVQPTRAILLSAKEGQMTPPVITSSGIELYAVCARRSINRNDEQRKQVRSKLVSQEYDLLARRHLNDLHQDAYVDMRENAKVKSP